MSADSWEEVEGIVAAAADAEPAARAAILAARCSGRPALRAEVESLLSALAEADAFLETPPIPAASTTDPMTEDAPSIGSWIGPYQLVEVIGEGGMGRVFRAERADGEFTHQVAIKVIRVPGASDVRRFRAERQILATLQHPHIVALLDGGTLPSGCAYLAMEYVRGTAITTYCREQRLPLEDRLRLFQQVALAVHHAHEQRVVHRDIKPSNVLVTTDGTPKVVDFGIAKLLDQSAAAAGGATIQGFNPFTPNYASPEQLRGLPVTPASDVYALGVLLYEMLTGVRPYDTAGKPLDEVLDLVLKRERTAPSAATVPAEARPPYALKSLGGNLDAIVLRAMARTPEARYRSVKALAENVVSWLEGTRAARPRGRFSAWHRRAVTACAFGMLFLAAVGDPDDVGLAGSGRGSHASDASRSLRRGGTSNTEAWEAYERGRRIWRTRTDLSAAIRSYRQAISLDPDFALAHVALANAYAVHVSPSPEAEHEVAEAFRLAPGLGEAHASQGFIRMFHYWDWLGAEESLRRATALVPDDALAHHWLGCYFMLTRRFEEARQSLELALRLDPASPPILRDLGLVAYYSGNYDGAARYCEQARNVGPDWFLQANDCLARVYERQGRYDEAWSLDEWALNGARPRAGTGRERLDAAARLWIGKTIHYMRGEAVGAALVNPNLSYRLATAYARLADKANTLAWLDTGIGWHAFVMPFTNVDPVFDGMRDDPGFSAILARMGLPAR